MLDAATQKFDNVNALAPEKQTLVHTIMNRSRIAEKIVDQMHDILQKPKKVKIVYFGMIKTFLKLLVQQDDDVSRYNCLNSLRGLIVENEDNLNSLLDNQELL